MELFVCSLCLIVLVAYAVIARWRSARGWRFSGDISGGKLGLYMSPLIAAGLIPCLCLLGMSVMASAEIGVVVAILAGVNLIWWWPRAKKRNHLD